MPRQQSEMSCGWGISFLLGLVVGAASSGMHYGLWYTRGPETTGDTLLGSQENRGLTTRGCHGGEPRSESERLQTPSLRVQDGRLMMEATEKVGARVRNTGQGFDLKVA
jgi:hypothetical protein